jgi:hypothetical protein
MYPFKIVQQDDQSWRLELNGIAIITDGFTLREKLHWLVNPTSAIAFFNVDGNLYGLSNANDTNNTAEDLYDALYRQYVYFNRDTFSDRFFKEYGFVHTDQSWRIEWTDLLGIKGNLEYRNNDGWYFNDKLLITQPRNIGELIHFYTSKTGYTLKRIA